MCLCARTCGWAVTGAAGTGTAGTADTPQHSAHKARSVSDPDESIPPGVDTVTKAGCQSCCSVAVTQGLPVFLHFLTQENITHAALSDLHSFFPLSRRT